MRRAYGASLIDGELLAAEYPNRGFDAGWRFQVSFGSELKRRIDVLLREDLPFRAPSISLVDRPEFLTWPHIESDGVLCLLGEASTIDPLQPRAVLTELLKDAFELIGASERGENVNHFKDEFLTYWSHATEKQGTPYYSLLGDSELDLRHSVLGGEQRGLCRRFLRRSIDLVEETFWGSAAVFGYCARSADLVPGGTVARRVSEENLRRSSAGPVGQLQRSADETGVAGSGANTACAWFPDAAWALFCGANHLSAQRSQFLWAQAADRWQRISRRERARRAQGHPIPVVWKYDSKIQCGKGGS